jgi:uncharacterized protein DUF1707
VTVLSHKNVANGAISRKVTNTVNSGEAGMEEMRAGDKDRQAVADKLKQALDEGRLDLAEYDERLQQTYAAKTYGDLDGLLDDLPGLAGPPAVATSSEPAATSPAPPPTRSEKTGRLVRMWLGGFGGVFVVSSVIWLVVSLSSGHLLYFWPVWLLIPMVLGLLSRIGNPDDHDRHREDRDERRRERRDDRRDRRRDR